MNQSKEVSIEMTSRAQGNEFRSTQVCVDDRRDGRFSGRLYNPYWEGGVPFSSVMEFLIRMEELLDQMQFPQSFTAKRTFRGPPGQGAVSQLPPDVRQGEEATFYLKVLFRQNASWQGTVKWIETGQEESFRSVLELLLLMDSAVSKDQLKFGKRGAPAVLQSKAE